MKRNHELFQVIIGIKLPKSTVFNHKNKVSYTYIENKESSIEEYVESEVLEDN